MLNECSISYVTFEDEDSGGNLARYNAVLELKNDGAWTYKPVKGGRIVEEGRDATS